MAGSPPVGDVTLGVDLISITVEQPLGTPATSIDATAPFYVTATLRASGFLRTAAVPYSIRYFYESFGPGPEGTLGIVAGNLNGVPITGMTTDYNGTATRLTVPASTLINDRTWKLTAIADFSTMPGTGAFIEGPVIATRP